jgi:hypothetical protein
MVNSEQKATAIYWQLTHRSIQSSKRTNTTTSTTVESYRLQIPSFDRVFKKKWRLKKSENWTTNIEWTCSLAWVKSENWSEVITDHGSEICSCKMVSLFDESGANFSSSQKIALKNEKRATAGTLPQTLYQQSLTAHRAHMTLCMWHIYMGAWLLERRVPLGSIPR